MSKALLSNVNVNASKYIDTKYCHSVFVEQIKVAECSLLFEGLQNVYFNFGMSYPKHFGIPAMLYT